MKDERDTQTADYLEDAEAGGPIDVEQAITDEALQAGGLKPVKAWVRTKQANNAIRTERYKQRQAAAGVKQINIQAPQEAHDVLKAIGTRTKAGEPLADVLRDLAGESEPAIQAIGRTLNRGGFRARLILWLAGQPG